MQKLALFIFTFCLFSAPLVAQAGQPRLVASHGDWEVYEAEFMELMAKRSIETQLSQEAFESSCLLCSEHLPKLCHRRLVLEYLQEKWGGISVSHLV